MPLRSEKLQTCLREAESVCQGHDMVVIKSLRYALTSVRRLMTLHPDLAVLFLVRDPRGNIWSRMKTFGSPTMSTLRPFAGKYCNRIWKDVMEIQDMYREAPYKFRFLRYEDLATRPVAVSKNMYRFANLAWTKQVEVTIIRQTNG